jgi:hypothetical protein
MEVGRTVIPLDDGERAARPEHLLECDQSLDRLRQVLQHEADEDVVEGDRVELQIEDVRLHELHVGKTRSRDLGPGPGYGVGGYIDRHDARMRAVASQRDGLCPDPAPGFEHSAVGRISGLRVKQVNQRSRLIMKAVALSLVVAVDVPAGHGRSLTLRVTLEVTLSDGSGSSLGDEEWSAPGWQTGRLW